MEGGTDFDMTVLDQATEEERDGNRSRNNSESAPLERWGVTACLQTGEFFYATYWSCLRQLGYKYCAMFYFLH